MFKLSAANRSVFDAPFRAVLAFVIRIVVANVIRTKIAAFVQIRIRRLPARARLILTCVCAAYYCRYSELIVSISGGARRARVGARVGVSQMVSTD